nr:MAG TPA: hypothetical protein [Caudoviricetes sp.]
MNSFMFLCLVMRYINTQISMIYFRFNFLIALFSYSVYITMISDKIICFFIIYKYRFKNFFIHNSSIS